MKSMNDQGTSGDFSAVSVPERRLRWDAENLSRPTGARQSAAYREAVKREIERMESAQ